jgi:hypothetical protein
LELESLDLRPRKTDITVSDVAVVWTPWKVESGGAVTPLFAFPSS